MPRDTGYFISDLRKEILSAQQTRYKHTQQKLIFVVGLLGVGKVLLPPQDFFYVVYLAPIISFVFDLYIAGANFGIRRIGLFILWCEKAPKEERYWEFLLPQNRDLFASVAGPISSFAVLAISILFIISLNRPEIEIRIWIAIILIFVLLILTKGFFLKRRLNHFKADLENAKVDFDKDILKRTNRANAADR